MKVFIESCILILLLIAIGFTSGSLQQTLVGAFIALLINIVIEVILWFYSKRWWLGVCLRCMETLAAKRGKDFSILSFRIEVNGKYLLIRSHRIPNKFQPVGGVYKYIFPEGKRQLEEMTLITDSHFENDEDNEYDLRLKMRDRSNLPKFLNWFIKGENREVDPWREFYEELIKAEILPHNVFEHIQYELMTACAKTYLILEHSEIEYLN